jgi:hypothetical protein
VKHFADIYLGGTTATPDARKILVPIFLPNSTYFHRNGRSSKGHGIWPCYTGSNRVEVQFTMAPSTDVVQVSAQVPGSIKDACKMMIHVVNMREDDVQIYKDQRGKYSVYNRRFHEITDGWTSAASGVTQKITENKPLGTITELICLAVDAAGDPADANIELTSHVVPDLFEIRSDSVVQKSLDSAVKNQIELWTNGFIDNDHFSMPGRLCFAAHAAETDSANIYTGGYNMKLSSTMDIRLKFPTAVKYKLYAIQIQRQGVTNLGRLTASLD